MKGFKDKHKKFHPITEQKGIRKLRNRSTKTKGVLIRKKIEPRSFHRWIGKTKEENEKFIKNSKKIIDDFSSASGGTVQKWLNSQLKDVAQRNRAVIGRDKDIIKPFLENRLSSKKGKWNLAIPIPSKDEKGRTIVEDLPFITTSMNKGKVRWESMSPQEFLQLASSENFESDSSKQTIESLRESIREAKPIETPFFEITWKDGRWKIRGHEGRHRAEASRLEGLESIPVIIEADIGVYQMDEIQERSFFNKDMLEAQNR